MIDFKCVYFGQETQSDKEFWNINVGGFASAKQAEKHGMYMMPTAGVFGFAVIEDTEDCWKVVEECSILPPNASVSATYDCGVKYNVQPAS